MPEEAARAEEVYKAVKSLGTLSHLTHDMYGLIDSIFRRRPDTAAAKNQYELNKDLFSIAIKTNRQGMEKALRGLGAALVVDKNGKPINVIVTESDIREEVHFALVDLIGRNKGFEIIEERLFVKDMRFDPEKARKIGIRPGPLFGKLSSGLEVRFDGQKITPDMVIVTEKTVVDLDGEPLREKIFKYVISKWLKKED